MARGAPLGATPGAASGTAAGALLSCSEGHTEVERGAALYSGAAEAALTLSPAKSSTWAAGSLSAVPLLCASKVARSSFSWALPFGAVRLALVPSWLIPAPLFAASRRAGECSNSEARAWRLRKKHAASLKLSEARPCSPRLSCSFAFPCSCCAHLSALMSKATTCVLSSFLSVPSSSISHAALGVSKGGGTNVKVTADPGGLGASAPASSVKMTLTSSTATRRLFTRTPCVCPCDCGWTECTTIVFVKLRPCGTPLMSVVEDGGWNVICISVPSGRWLMAWRSSATLFIGWPLSLVMDSNCRIELV